MQGRSFTKFQNFNLAIRRMIYRYKNYFIDKAKYCLKIEQDNVNSIPFELEIQNLDTTSKIYANDINLYTPNHAVQGVHSVQYDDAEDESLPVNMIKSD